MSQRCGHVQVYHCAWKRNDVYTAWPHVIMIAPWGLPSERFCGIEAEVIALGGLWMAPVAAMHMPIKKDGEFAFLKTYLKINDRYTYW